MPTPEETTAKGYADLARLGTLEYMKSRPSTFPYVSGYKWYNDPRYGLTDAPASALASVASNQGFSQAIGWPISSAIAELRAEIEDLKTIRMQWGGAEGTYIRWGIDNQIARLEWEIDRKINKSQTISQGQAVTLGQAETAAFQAREGARLEATGPGFVPGAEAAGTGGERIAGAMGRDIGGAGTAPQPGEPPIPDWMRPYVVTQPRVKGQGWIGGEEVPGSGLATQAQYLRPLGAQAELNVDQLGQMAGYLAMMRGRPTDIAGQWAPYSRLSQSLFPKQAKLGKRWRVAKQ